MSNTDLPGYWMNEASGVLRPVIELYLTGGHMTARDIAIMRNYLRQWMEGPRQGPMVDVLRTQIGEIIDRDDIKRWLDRAMDQNIDPL
jgi:hypothetical protein